MQRGSRSSYSRRFLPSVELHCRIDSVYAQIFQALLDILFDIFGRITIIAVKLPPAGPFPGSWAESSSLRRDVCPDLCQCSRDSCFPGALPPESVRSCHPHKPARYQKNCSPGLLRDSARPPFFYHPNQLQPAHPRAPVPNFTDVPSGTLIIALSHSAFAVVAACHSQRKAFHSQYPAKRSQLDAGETTGRIILWSGTSKQVWKRKPFEPNESLGCCG